MGSFEDEFAFHIERGFLPGTHTKAMDISRRLYKTKNIYFYYMAFNIKIQFIQEKKNLISLPKFFLYKVGPILFQWDKKGSFSQVLRCNVCCSSC